MEIQAVVEHEPPNKGMEWEAQSAEEMGKKYYPLMGPGGGMSSPLLGSQCAMLLDRYPVLRSLVMCSSLTVEANHLPPAPDIFGEGRGEMRELGRWSLSARGWISKGGRRRG